MTVIQPHCFKVRGGCAGGGKGYLGQNDKTYTLSTSQDQYLYNDNKIRKLTPLECERLQGFPDNWTQIPYKGKPVENCQISVRYKAIGNSGAIPCVTWIGKRIKQELEKSE